MKVVALALILCVAVTSALPPPWYWTNAVEVAPQPWPTVRSLAQPLLTVPSQWNPEWRRSQWAAIEPQFQVPYVPKSFASQVSVARSPLLVNAASLVAPSVVASIPTVTSTLYL